MERQPKRQKDQICSTIDPSQKFPIVALDNTGTISQSTVITQSAVGAEDIDKPISAYNSSKRRLALITLDHEKIEKIEAKKHLGPIETPITSDFHIAIANHDPSIFRIHRALKKADIPAQTILDLAQQTYGEHTNSTTESTEPVSSLPVSIQLVVDIDNSKLIGFRGHTATPTESGIKTVHNLSAAGYELHIVSGDSLPVLQHLRERVSIQSLEVHPYQSATDKATTLSRLSQRASSLLMAGDYINDLHAFDAADYAVFIDSGDALAAEHLLSHTDETVSSISKVPQICERVFNKTGEKQ
jgi:P-type E1-E2 ATPase